MWCIKCGKQIPDGSRFCGYCGATQAAATAPTPQHVPHNAPEPQKKEKNKAAMIIWIIAAILILAAIALVLIFVVFPDGIGNGNKPTAVEDRDDDTDLADEDEPEEVVEEDADEDTTEVTPETPPEQTIDEVPSEVAGTGYDVGDVMYDFSVPTIDGGTFTLSENLGKPVFINIFATWCPPCIGEMPYIEELYQEYSDLVTFIVVDEGEGLSIAQGFADDNNYTLPFAYAENGNFLPNYNIDFIPQTFVLDANGTIVEFFPGGSSLEAFESAITVALGIS